MSWAEERQRLLARRLGNGAEAPSVPTEAPERNDVEPIYPLPVRWGRERGDIAVRDPFTGEWIEMAYADATPVWKAALRQQRRARQEGHR